MIRIIIEGCKAGAIAGLILGFLLVTFVSPVILEAEHYEIHTPPVAPMQMQNTHTQSTATVSVTHSDSMQSDMNSGEEFEPNAWQRPVLTVFGGCLLGIAYGILAALFIGLALKQNLVPEFSDGSKWVIGLLVGALGFLVFQGIPAMGLHPTPPGIVGAANDLSVRQHWWISSIVCSSIGLVAYGALKARMKNSLAPAALAAGVVAIPFIVGVPLHSEVTTAPEAIIMHFTWVSLLVGLIFWIALGTLLSRFVGAAEPGRS